MYELYQPGGYRQLITLKCPSNKTREELKDWWLNTHAEYIKNLSDLRWYTVCFAFEPIGYSNSSPGNPLQFDGYEELYFDSLDDLKKAYQSDIMKSSFGDMSNIGLDNPKLFSGLWAEANIIKMEGLSSPPKQKGCYRIFGGCNRTPGMTKKDLKDWYYEHAAYQINEEGKMINAGIIGYIHNFSLDDSPFGLPFVDAYCNNWWGSLEDMRKTFESDIWKNHSLGDRERHIDIYDKSLFVGAVAEEHVINLP